MSEAPALNAALMMERISRGELPRDFMMFAAQGLLPLPQDDLVAVLGAVALPRLDRLAGARGAVTRDTGLE